MHLEPFTYERPTSLREFEAVLARRAGEANILAGGTDLLVLVKEKVLSPKALIDIGSLAELQGISRDPSGGLTILAGTKVATIEADPLVKEFAPALAFAAAQLGSVQVRMMATMAGNVCHASPSAETPPVLLAHGAEVTLAKEGGERRLPLSEFFLSYRKTALQPGEYLKAFHLPALPPRAAVAYRFRGLRNAMEIDMVNVGLYLELDAAGTTAKGVRIALGAVGPIPYRALEAEKALAGKPVGDDFAAEAATLAMAEAKPIDDVRASADYRRKMIGVMLKRAIGDCLARLSAARG
ncbi:MAG: xanthine dehydrogenase family protein subunit M [Deltaproteobacteria bacterium]|nr:xanthine dehydrogenase family protein subunit M [Deltaproteobacteria bacterium]